MTKHQFLSEPWIAEARRIREEFVENAPATPPVQINLVVTDVPFGEGSLEAHIDSSGGQVQLDHGHLEKADATLTSDYLTIRAIFVEQDPAAAMQAFMSGKIRVQGDLAKLMSLQSSASSLPPEDQEIVRQAAQRVKDMTAE